MQVLDCTRQFQYSDQSIIIVISIIKEELVIDKGVHANFKVTSAVINDAVNINCINKGSRLYHIF